MAARAPSPEEAHSCPPDPGSPPEGLSPTQPTEPDQLLPASSPSHVSDSEEDAQPLRARPDRPPTATAAAATEPPSDSDPPSAASSGLSTSSKDPASHADHVTSAQSATARHTNRSQPPPASRRHDRSTQPTLLMAGRTRSEERAARRVAPLAGDLPSRKRLPAFADVAPDTRAPPPPTLPRRTPGLGPNPYALKCG
jgi:hypothetical protein